MSGTQLLLAIMFSMMHANALPTTNLVDAQGGSSGSKWSIEAILGVIAIIIAIICCILGLAWPNLRMRMRLRKARAAAVLQHQFAQETLPLSDSSLHSELAHHGLRRQPPQDQRHVYYVYADQVEFRMSQTE